MAHQHKAHAGVNVQGSSSGPQVLPLCGAARGDREEEVGEVQEEEEEEWASRGDDAQM